MEVPHKKTEVGPIVTSALENKVDTCSNVFCHFSGVFTNCCLHASLPGCEPGAG